MKDSYRSDAKDHPSKHDISASSETIARLRRHQALVAVLTFSAYAALHCCRKAFGNGGPDMTKQWHLEKKTQGMMDTTFMFAYAIGLYISGMTGDKFDVVNVESLGLLLTAIVVFIFGGLYPYFHVTSQYVFISLWFINGLVQSTGWPTAVKLMGNWFDENNSGSIFGIWSANACVGNLIAGGVVAIVLHFKLPIQWFFWISSAFVLVTAASIRLCLVAEPNQRGLPDPKDVSEGNLPPDGDLQSGGILEVREMGEPIGFFQALFIPNVIPYALCYACLKSVNYAMFFWLPSYLAQTMSDTKSDLISMMYDVGQILGGFVCGWFSDRLGRRAPPVLIFIFISIIPIFLLRLPDPKIQVIIALCFTSGFFVGGPANMISSAISADLGKDEMLGGNAEALATVAGIIDGTGSVGAAAMQYVVAWVSDYGWEYVFIILAAMLLLSGLSIANLGWREMKEVFVARQYARLGM